MKLPTQAKSVERTDRMGEAKATGINPALLNADVLELLKNNPMRHLKGIMG